MKPTNPSSIKINSLNKEPQMKSMPDIQPDPTASEYEFRYGKGSLSSSMQAIMNGMPAAERQVHDDYGHRRDQVAFVGAELVIYECMGRDRNDLQRPAKERAILTVVHIDFSLEGGLTATVRNEVTGQVAIVGHTPVRIFDFPIFLSIPLKESLRKSQLVDKEGKMYWDYSVLFHIKTRNRASFYSRGNTYIETHRELVGLYPNQAFTRAQFPHRNRAGSKLH